MFERHFGLRENPFAAGHQSRFVYPSREHQEALAHLRFGIENREPFVLITGEVGTGKTTALYDVLAEYESRAVVALITNSSLTRDELLEEICLRFGLPTSGSVTKPQALAALERFLRQTRARGRHAILILDEAQNLERALLEEIRLLSNLEEQGSKLIQLFLVGQPELEDKLARPELRQLRQRITVFYRLNPLTVEDTERYIHHRIAVAGGHALSIFPADACHDVFEVTHGIPREINTVAGQAMLNAFVDDSPVVLREHVRTVERDNEFKSVLRGGAGGARISTLDSAPREPAAPPPQQGAPEPAAAPSPPPQYRAPEPAAAPSPPPQYRAPEPAAAPSTPPQYRAPEPAAAPSPPPQYRAPEPAAAPSPPPPQYRAPEPAAAPPPQPAPVASASAPVSSSVPHGLPPLHPSEPIAASTSADPRPVPAASPMPPSSASAAAASAPPGADAPPITEDEPVETKPSDSQQPPKRSGAVAPAGTAQAWGDWLSSLAQLPSVFEEAEKAAAEQADAADAPAEAAAPGSPAQAAADPGVEPEPAGSAPVSAAMSSGEAVGTQPGSAVSAQMSAEPAAVAPPAAPAPAETAAYAGMPAEAPAHREPEARVEVEPAAAAPTHAEPPARVQTWGPPPLEVERPAAYVSSAAPAAAVPPARLEPPAPPRVESAPQAAPADSVTLPDAPAPATPISRVEALRRSMRDQWPPVFPVSGTPENAGASTGASASDSEEAATSAAGAKPVASERTARASSLFGFDSESAGRTPRRLEFLEEEKAAENGKPMRLLATVAIVAVVVVAGALGIRAWIRAAKPANTDSPAVVPSAVAPAPAETSPANTGATSATTTPAPQATTPAREPAGSAAPPSAARQPAQSPTTSGQPVTSSTGSPSKSPSVAAGTAPTATTGSAGTSGNLANPPRGGSAGAAGAAAGGAAAGAAASSGAAAGGAASGAATGASSAGGAAAAPGATSAGGSAATETPARSAAASPGSYGIAVGTYLNEDRAEEERAKLAESTRLPARVVPVAEDGDTVYRLVLGSFESRQSAERSASSLIERGLVDEARVVPLTNTTASKP